MSIWLILGLISIFLFLFWLLAPRKPIHKPDVWEVLSKLHHEGKCDKMDCPICGFNCEADE